MLFTPFRNLMPQQQPMMPQFGGTPNPLNSHDAIVSSLMKLGNGGGDPDDPKKKKVYQTQAEVDAANLFAQQFAERRKSPMDAISPNQLWVARKPGDPVVRFVDEKGNDYVPPPKRKLSFQVPEGIKYEDLGKDNGDVWYNDPNTGDLVYVDPSVLNLPRFKQPADEANKAKLMAFQQKVNK